jgi:hypothetical protein
MTVGAIDTRFLCSVAVHTAAHRNIRIARKLFLRFHFSVAFRARVSCFQMRPVAETHKGCDLVNPHPRNSAIVLSEGCQLLNPRTLGLDRRVALHTFRSRDKSHPFSGVRIRMAHLALQLQISRVCLMTEWQRLLGTLRRCSVKSRRHYYRDYKFQRFPARICSAIYSEARIDSDRIVIVGF